MEDGFRPAFPALLVGFAALSLLLHLNSFWNEHSEGDEVVYQTLAREMGWDLSHYTTRDDPLVRQLPSPTYRQPLFIHPPLLPLVLKLGGRLGNPVATGLVFANLAMLLLLVFTERAMRLLEVPPRTAAVAFAGVALCPLLLFSTTRLHHDGLLGIFLVCGVVAYLEALDRPSWGRALLAGGLFVAALNVRYSAVAALPLIALIQLYHLYRLGGGRAAREPRSWRVFGIVVLLVATLGLQHTYRLAATLGTVWPWTIMSAGGEVRGWNEFTRAVLSRSRGDVIAYLLMVFPLLLVFATPWPYRSLWRDVRRRSWAPLFVLIFLYLAGVALAFQFDQLRYFAPALPFLYLGLPSLLAGATGRFRAVLIGLSLPTLLFMVTTGYYVAAVKPKTARIIPSLVFYVPPLRASYR